MNRLYRLICGFFALTDYTSVAAGWQIKENGKKEIIFLDVCPYSLLSNGSWGYCMWQEINYYGTEVA
jgi:hypothetical protein